MSMSWKFEGTAHINKLEGIEKKEKRWKEELSARIKFEIKINLDMKAHEDQKSLIANKTIYGTWLINTSHQNFSLKAYTSL